MLRWVLLLVVLGAFAGGVAYLHSRARPIVRGKSPAELALEKELPPLEFADVTVEEVLKELENRAGVKIQVDWNDRFMAKARGRRLVLRTERETLSASLMRLDADLRTRRPGGGFPVDITVPHALGPEESVVHFNDGQAPAQYLRVYDVSDLVDSFCGNVRKPRPLPWMIPDLRTACVEQLANDLSHIDGWQTQRPAIVGTRVILRQNRWGQRSAAERLEFLSVPEQTTPPNELAVMDQPIPEGGRQVLTLEKTLEHLLGGRLEYRVNWPSLERLGVMRNTMVGVRGSVDHPPPTVASELAEILGAARRNVGLARLWIADIDYGFEENVLVIRAGEEDAVRRRYSMSFAWDRPDGRPWVPADRTAFEDLLTERSWFRYPHPYPRSRVRFWVGEDLVVIGGESAHADIRRRRAELKRAGWKVED